MNWANDFSEKYGNTIFGQIFGHQKVQIDRRNKKIEMKKLIP